MGWVRAALWTKRGIMVWSWKRRKPVSPAATCSLRRYVRRGRGRNCTGDRRGNVSARTRNWQPRWTRIWLGPRYESKTGAFLLKSARTAPWDQTGVVAELDRLLERQPLGMWVIDVRAYSPLYAVVSAEVLRFGLRSVPLGGGKCPIHAVCYGMKLEDLDTSGQGRAVLEHTNNIQLDEFENYLFQLKERLP